LPGINNLNKYIAVAGNIGSGKSELIEFLCNSYRLVRLDRAHENNPYIDNFYNDMQNWSFHSQIFILTKKFQHFQNLSPSGQSVIQSRTIHEDAEIFARNLFKSGQMSEIDFRTYYDFYKCLTSATPAPDLLIYLHSSVSSLRKRLRANHDPHELLISDTYLRHINRLYVNWIADYDLSEVVIIDTEQLDVASNFVDRVDILESIERFI
jgi:deoxyadenosine/deoxycytidine kinase